MKTIRYSFDFHPAAVLLSATVLVSSIWWPETAWISLGVFILGIQIKREEW